MNAVTPPSPGQRTSPPLLVRTQGEAQQDAPLVEKARRSEPSPRVELWTKPEPNQR
jgi:hypothetical protein